MTRQRLPPVTHTDALFADQSQSILDNLVTLLGQNPARDWTQNAVIRNTSGFAKEETRSDNVRYPGFARVAAGIQALPVEWADRALQDSIVKRRAQFYLARC